MTRKDRPAYEKWLSCCFACGTGNAKKPEALQLFIAIGNPRGFACQNPKVIEKGLNRKRLAIINYNGDKYINPVAMLGKTKACLKKTCGICRYGN